MRMLWLAIVFFAVVALQLFVPLKGRKELAFIPQSVRYLNRDILNQGEGAKGARIPFLQQNGYGSHGPDLQDFVFAEFDPNKKVRSSEKFTLEHDWEQGVTTVRDARGVVQGSFPSTGAVLQRNGRIYEISSTTHQIKEYDLAGQLLWQHAYLAPPTSLSSNATSTSLSYVNGRLDVLDRSGLLQQQFRYTGSRVNSLYGQAISADGQYIALIGGVDPQRFQVLRLRNDSYYPLTSHTLAEQKISSYWLTFSQGLPYIFYSPLGKLVVYNYETGNSTTLPFPARLIDFEENVGRGLQFFLGSNDKGGGRMVATLGIRGHFFTLDIGRRPYSLVSRGDNLYLSLENAIAHYRLVEI